MGRIRSFILIFGLSFLLALGLCNTAKREVKSRPNIVVFLCDDLGYGDLSLYGHPYIQTPYLDSLALSGIMFTSFYSAAPVCSPSRVGLLTGRSPNRAGIYDWIPHGNEDRGELRQLMHLNAEEKTISQVLKSSGYHTCLVGKWHCNSQFNSEVQPQPGDFGFDHWFATRNNAYPGHKDPVNFVRNGKELGEIKGYSSQIIVDEAIHWLDDLNVVEPFFILIAFHEPHEPVVSPPELVEKYIGVSRNRDEAHYFANVENVDLAVKKMMNALKKRKLEDNTFVVFTSDNGPETLNRYPGSERSYGSPGILKGMKLWTHDAGFRVPGFVYWPSKIKNPAVIDEPVSALDLFPSFATLAGVQTVYDQLDGIDIIPLVEGEKIKRDKPLLWCYYNALNEVQVAMIHEGWKIMAGLFNQDKKISCFQNVYDENERVIKNAELGDFQLYHIAEDQSELKEVSSIYTEEFEKIKEILKEEYSELVSDSYVWRSNYKREEKGKNYE